MAEDPESSVTPADLGQYHWSLIEASGQLVHGSTSHTGPTKDRG